MTLSLLWEEYRADHPKGYGYSRFCELYTRWEGKLSPVMRQPLPASRTGKHMLPGSGQAIAQQLAGRGHPAGGRLFVDYAGDTVDVIDPPDRRGAHGTAVCRDPRGLELYLCRGGLDAIPA